jgi:hypothetical protein
MSPSAQMLGGFETVSSGREKFGLSMSAEGARHKAVSGISKRSRLKTVRRVRRLPGNPSTRCVGLNRMDNKAPGRRSDVVKGIAGDQG